MSKALVVLAGVVALALAFNAPTYAAEKQKRSSWEGQGKNVKRGYEREHQRGREAFPALNKCLNTGRCK